jgi:hypothetical protein
MVLSKQIIVAFFLSSFVLISYAQDNYIGQFNPITTSVPFLSISPDARGGSMGDAGVASEPDAYSMHYNPAKYAFIKKELGAGISYSPWLHGATNDISLLYLSGYTRIDKNQVIAASLRYFNLGNIEFMDQNGWSVGMYKPNEFSLDATYSRMLTSNFSMAIAGRFIHSNITQGQDVGGQATKPGNTVAADVSMFQRFPVEFDKVTGKFSWGLNISNIGAKIAYSDDNTRKDFIPTTLKFGPSLELDLDDYNQMTFMVDFGKLLVPTNAMKASDSTIVGMDPNVSVPIGMIHSFYDAPGGFKEEMQEIFISSGIEYWYAQQFALRGGFFYEAKNKGDRKFFTLGAGFRYNVLGIDFSYLVPLSTNHPLENTLRFSLLLNFDTIGR